MRIPHVQNLASQSFLFDTLEFVWHFHFRPDGPTHLDVNEFYDVIVFRISKDGSCYMEIGPTYRGDFTLPPRIFECRLTKDTALAQLTKPENWNKLEFPPAYNNLSNGKDLVELVVDCIDYLK